MELGLGWGRAVSSPMIWPVPPTPVRRATVSRPFMLLPDTNDRIWPGLIPQAVLSQDQRSAVGGPQIRPLVVPSVADVVTVATAINTLFSMVGPRFFLTTGGVTAQIEAKLRTLNRIIVSVSGPTLVVIGGSTLTVGSPGVNEIARLRFPAAGIQVLEYDGAHVQELDGGDGGNWQAYTSAAVTFDATIIGG